MNLNKGVLFDKDGTIINFKKNWKDAIDLFMKKVEEITGKSSDEIQNRLGYSNGDIIPNSPIASSSYKEIGDILGDFEICREKSFLKDEVENFFNNYFDENISKLELIGNVKGLFVNLKNNGFKIGIATSDNLYSTINTLNHFNLYEYIDFIGTGDNYPSKPNPEILYDFCKINDLNPKDVLVVGDSLVDIELGSNGLKGIPVLSGTSNTEDFHDLGLKPYKTIHHIPYNSFYNILQ